MNLTLWNHPEDNGLRIAIGIYRTPGGYDFRKISSGTAATLAEEIGHLLPTEPGEVAYIEIIRDRLNALKARALTYAEGRRSYGEDYSD